MCDFFFLAGANDDKNGVAVVPPDFDELAFWDLLEHLKDEASWTPLNLVMKSGILNDYPTSDAIDCLCSKLLRNVIAPFSEDIIWLPLSILYEGHDEPFFVMHFTDFPSVLDEKKSEIRNGRVIHPVLSSSKLQGLQVFRLNALDPCPIVSEQVKAAVLDAGCQGLDFEQIEVS